MASVALESALLWTRWALRRLGHLLADYPNDLIDAVKRLFTVDGVGGGASVTG